MMKHPISILRRAAVLGLTTLGLTACGDEASLATVDAIWLNIADAPTHTVECAYPKQVLRLEGRGFSDLTALYVNDTEVNIDGSYVYATDRAYTFTVPSDVHISEDYDVCTLRVVTPAGETLYEPFLIKPNSQKPSITAVSATALKAGTALTLTGKNLEGVVEVWLPTTYDGRVQCSLTADVEATAKSVTVTVPEGADFASGRVEVVMEKKEYITSRTGRTYRETAYSSILNFTTSNTD